MEYFCCKCYYFNDEFIVCKECSTWIDNVETTIAKHLNEFKPVVHCRRWKNKKKSETKKVYINFHYRINGEFEFDLYLNHVLFSLYVFNFIF